MADQTQQPPLTGWRVVELSHEVGMFAGKLFADGGADVITVEAPSGSNTREWGPFVDDQPGNERSLHWWHYNTSKRGVTLDIENEADREKLRQLVATADVFIECERPGRMAELGLDYDDLKACRDDLIYVSITPFGRNGPRSGEVATDLTVLANAGPAWSCGYDDHTIPPVRGGGYQGATRPAATSQ